MIEKKKAVIGIRGLWIYLVCIGVLWFMNSFAAMNSNRAFSLASYQIGLDIIKTADESRRDVPKEKLSEYDSTSQSIVEDVKQLAIRRDNPPAHIISIVFVCFLTGFLYIWTGLKVFLRSKKANKVLRLGCWGILLNYVLIFWGILKDFSFIGRILTKMDQLRVLSDPEVERLNIWDGSIPGFGMIASIAGIIVVTLTIYVFLPRYFISRPSIKEQLT